MAKDHSFDIVSEVDFQEVNNAVDQCKKEVFQRYDFKGSNSVIEWDLQAKTITLQTETDMRLKALGDILQTKLAKRQVSLKAIEFGTAEKAAGGTLRQVLQVRHGIPSEKAKEIVKFIKTSKLKAQPQIQQEQIRVQSAKIDTLQEVMQLVKGKGFGIDLQFINYR